MAAIKNCEKTGGKNGNELIHSLQNLGFFKEEFLQKYSVHRVQIFRDNGNCYALSIFRDFILLASLDMISIC